MTDFPINHLQSINSTGKLAAVSARMITLFRTACGALAQATLHQAQRGTRRRSPEEILMARSRREEARSAVDRLLR